MNPEVFRRGLRVGSWVVFWVLLVLFLVFSISVDQEPSITWSDAITWSLIPYCFFGFSFMLFCILNIKMWREQYPNDPWGFYDPWLPHDYWYDWIPKIFFAPFSLAAIAICRGQENRRRFNREVKKYGKELFEIHQRLDSLRDRAKKMTSDEMRKATLGQISEARKKLDKMKTFSERREVSRVTKAMESDNRVVEEVGDVNNLLGGMLEAENIGTSKE